MGKMTTFILLFTGVVLCFHLFGILTEDSAPTLLNLLLHPENIQDSSLWTKVILAIEGLGAGALVIIGLITKNELAVIAPAAIFLGNILIDYMQVFNKVYAHNQVLALLLFAPMLVLFAVTLVDWWRGRD